MDSSNSGSIQSSSSGDNEDFTSPAESMSFLNFPQPPAHPPPLTSQYNHHYSSSSFDLLSPYFTAFNSLPPDASPLQLDPTWPKSITGDPSSSSASSYPTCTAPLAGALFAAPSLSLSHVPAVGASSNPSTVHDPGQSDDLLAPATDAPAPAVTKRSSKKRSRASRRAPTTVLTTDASNFRTMVQQFTGFPTPPFAPASSSMAGFSHPQFDFFRVGGGGEASGPPPYLLQPFAKKVPSSSTFSPLSSSSSSLVEAIAYMNRATSAANPSLPLINSVAITSSPSASANTSSSFRERQLPLVDRQSTNPLDLQGPNLAFQSFLRSNPFKLDYIAEGSQRNLIATDVVGLAGSKAGMLQMPRSNAVEEEAQARAAVDAEKGPRSVSSSSTTATREINSRVSSWTFPPD